MNKEQILGHLRAAKAAHIKWVQKAKLLVSGIDVDEDAIPVDSTECKFGKWFYAEGQILNALTNNPVEFMANIEKLHFELHDTYLQIFNIYFSKPKGGFFTKLFGAKKQKIEEHDAKLAYGYYETLEQTSKNLLEEINRLERRVLANTEEHIQKLL
jgi:hypothetical protein